MNKPVCAIVGVGPGNGEAFARRMAADGYAVALMARSDTTTGPLAAELDDAVAVTCDVTDAASVEAAFATTREALGEVNVLLYNAGAGVFGSIEDTSAQDLDQAWRINCLGLYQCTHQVLTAMKAARAGSIVVTGATASLRGGARFAAFASAKAAQRSLAQSMARHLGPQGIHVALVIVDGVIDTDRAKKMMPDLPDEAKLRPEAIADSIALVVKQHPSAWTFELDVRPSVENW